MKRNLSTLAIASLIALNPLYTPFLLAQQFVPNRKIAKQSTEQGYWGLSQSKTLADIKLQSSGGFRVTDPRVHAALGYDPSRQWRSGQSASDILKVGETDELFNIKNLTPRQLAELSGTNVNSIPLLSLYDQSTISDLIKINPELGNAPASSIPAIRDLVQGRYSESIQSGILVAENYSNDIKAFLEQRSELRNLPLKDILRGDYQRSLPVAQAIAFKELQAKLPEQFKTLPIKSLPALTDLSRGNIAGALESGVEIAVDHFDTLDRVFEKHPQLKNVPIADVINGKWDRVLNTAEKVAFDKLGQTLPLSSQQFGGKALPILKAARDGDFSSVYQISGESIKEFNQFLENNPHLKNLPLNQLLNGNVQAALPKAQQVAIYEISTKLPDQYKGLPAQGLDALYDLKDGRWENSIEKGVQLSSEHFKEVQGFFKDHPELEQLSISEILSGDFSTAIDAGEEAALKQLAKVNPYLGDLPLGAIAKGNYKQALNGGIKLGTKVALDKLLADNPALQDVALGVLDNPRYSIGSVEGLADTSIGAINAIDSKALSEIPGLKDIPLDFINANNISALLKGDLFGRIDLPLGEKELIALNALSGFTRGKKFTPTPCDADADSKSDHCAHAELRDYAGLFGSSGKSLLGKQFVSSGHKGKGGWSFLKDIGNDGYEKAGVSPWGVSSKTNNLKLVINKVSEVDGAQTTTPSGYRVYTESGYVEFGLTFGICIRALFIDTCTASFIDLPTEFIPKELIGFKVPEGGRALINTTSSPPRIPKSLLRQYRQQYGLPQEDYCYAPPSEKSGEKTYEDLDSSDRVKVGEYDLSRIGFSGIREEYLHKETAEAFLKLQKAAARDGVNLSVGSGHRSIADQQKIWDSKRQAGQTDEQIAKVNTRPGQSQHHTGFSVDIVDLDSPGTDFNNGFRNTKSGEWLARNASKYGFEKSYPNEDNNGIQLEEWDWRFTGSDRARRALKLESDHHDGDGHNHEGDKAIASVGESAWGNSRDRANLILTSALEASGTQNQTDVAVSILNRVNSSRFPNNATDVTFASGQYQPNFGASPVGSKSEAIYRLAQYKFGGNVGAATQEYERIEQSLSNPENIISAQNHIGGATDFRGFTPDTLYRPGDPYRGNPSSPNGQANFFVQESRSVQVATATLDRLGIGSDRFTGISDGLSGGGSSCIASGGGPLVQGDGKSSGNHSLPFGPSTISSSYGARTHPVTGEPGKHHDGLDFAIKQGTPLPATEGGTVDHVGYLKGYGYTVIIDHGNGEATLYAHLSEYRVQKGQKVSKGQELALSGGEKGHPGAGTSTGPHLHFTFIKGYQPGNILSGQDVNPINILKLGG